jgi:uncharacterized protein (DUF1499 family)
MTGWIILAVVVAGMAYVRFSPTDMARYHKPISASTDEVRVGGAVRVIEGDAATLAKIDAAARALPRTRLVAGSVAEGLVTYQTRSAFFGFPDYTTVQLVDGHIRLFARLRFGNSDFGVNAERLKGLIAAAQG